MARDLTTAQSNLLKSQQLEYFVAVQIEFGFETSRFWTGFGEKEIDSQTYLGIGTFLSIDTIRESADFGAQSVKMTLSGVPSDLLSFALGIQYRNAKTTIKQGFNSLSTGEFVKDVFVGFIDTMAIIEGKGTSVITVNIENALAVVNRTAPLRYTDQSHRQKYRSDRGFEFVESLQNRAIAWGGEGNATLKR